MKKTTKNMICGLLFLMLGEMFVLLWGATAFDLNICAGYCTCKFSTVDCSHKYFAIIPGSIPNDTKRLDLRNNSLYFIPAYSFKDLLHLQHLDLSLNYLRFINDLAFVGPSQLLSINLSYSSFSAKDVPNLKGLDYLENLWISHCWTGNLPAYTFRNLTSLQRLDLSEDNIEEVDPEAFVGLDHLEFLDLSGNIFCLSKLDSTVFKPLKSLQTLSISKIIRDISCQPFQKNMSLSKLRTLRISDDNFPIDPLAWGIQGLTSLSVKVLLNVTLRGDMFLHVENLTTLDLDIVPTGSVSLMSDVFQNFGNLEQLMVRTSSTAEDELQSILNAIQKCKSLRTIDISAKLNKISKRSLRHLESTEIRELTLELGSGLEIEYYALQYLPHRLQTMHILNSPVRFMDVVSSGFDMLPNLSLFKVLFHDFQTMTTRYDIAHISTGSKSPQADKDKYFSSNIKKQNISRRIKLLREQMEENDVVGRATADERKGAVIEHRGFRDKERGKRAQVAEGNDCNQTNTTRSCLEMQNTFHTPIKREAQQFFQNDFFQNQEYSGQTKTRTLDFSRNYVHIPFNFYPAFPLQIECVDLSFNMIYTISFAFEALFTRVRKINLSNTKLSSINNGTLQNIMNLTHLELQNNKLGQIIGKGNTFQNLKNLQVLNLANNDIKLLHKDMLKDTSKIEVLNVSNNHLVSIDVHFSHTKLGILDLSVNNIQFISKDFMFQIHQLCMRSHLVINLVQNPLRCTCDNLDFFKSTGSSCVTLQYAHLTYCEFENGTMTTLDNINQVLDDLDRHCRSNVSILVGSVAGTLCLLFLIVGAVGYRYRWKLRYLYYASKLKWFQNGIDGYQRLFDYNAFVSYADGDSTFVRDNVIPNLETENNYRLCVHERDFTAGNSVACNISRAIHNSKKTIIVLTEYFLLSDWCMYEFNMARVHDVYSDRNVILIIFLNDLDFGKLPLDVLDLVRSKTYLKFPEEGTDRETFWRKCVEFIR